MLDTTFLYKDRATNRQLELDAPAFAVLAGQTLARWDTRRDDWHPVAERAGMGVAAWLGSNDDEIEPLNLHVASDKTIVRAVDAEGEVGEWEAYIFATLEFDDEQQLTVKVDNNHDGVEPIMTFNPGVGRWRDEDSGTLYERVVFAHESFFLAERFEPVTIVPGVRSRPSSLAGRLS